MRRKNLVVLTIMTIITLYIISPAQSANAAWGNVQLRIVSGSSATFTSVKVTGFNQNSVWSVWERTFDPGTKETTTTGWWWNGSRKTITVKFSTGERLECGVFTNNYPWTNVETITISSNGAIKASGPAPRCARL
jgi:hypothetical protein